jgi:hypothetical protein
MYLGVPVKIKSYEMDHKRGEERDGGQAEIAWHPSV